MGVSNGTTALGIAVALGEIKMPKAEQICNRPRALFLGRVVLVRRRTDTGADRAARQQGRAPAVVTGSATRVMKDALDIDGIYDAIRNAGLDLPERPRAERPRGQAS